MHELSILHIFLILFTIFVSFNFSRKTKLTKNIDYSHCILIFSPLILVLFKSQNTKPLQHLIVLYSYMLSINTTKNKIDNEICESNISYPFIISACLILIFWRLINPDQIILIYLYILIFLIYEYKKNYITLNQGINDLLITHFIFQLTK